MKMRRLIKPRSVSTSPPMSAGIRPSSSVRRYVTPAFGGDQLGPAPVEPAMIAFAVAVVAGPGPEVLVETLMAETHLVTQEIAPGNHTAAGLRTALPVVHIVLLEGASWAKHACSGNAQGFFD